MKYVLLAVVFLATACTSIPRDTASEHGFRHPNAGDRKN